MIVTQNTTRAYKRYEENYQEPIIWNYMKKKKKKQKFSKETIRPKLCKRSLN
jgi:hypothetical protein